MEVAIAELAFFYWNILGSTEKFTMSYQSYLDSLPKKRMGAGCLFCDDGGKLFF